MPHEYEQIFLEVADAIRHRDAQRLVELTSPEVEWRSFFAMGSEGSYRGHSGIRRYVADIGESWESLDPTIEDSLTVGSLVVAVGRIRYRGKASGAESESRAGWVLRFNGGKIVRFRAFSDPENTLEAAGLSE